MSRTFAMHMNQRDVEALLREGKIAGLELRDNYILDNQGNAALLSNSTLTFGFDNCASTILAKLRAAGCDTTYVGSL